MVRIAVGKSQERDATQAAKLAWRHLLSKLGGATPHFVVAAYTGKHDGAAVAAALAATASPGCQIVGVSAGCGIIFEDTWLSGAEGSALSLWGIIDPAGAYHTAYCGTGLVDDVKAKVKEVLEPQIERGGPRLSLAYTTATFEQTSIEGIQDVIGEDSGAPRPLPASRPAPPSQQPALAIAAPSPRHRASSLLIMRPTASHRRIATSAPQHPHGTEGVAEVPIWHRPAC